MIRFAAEVAPIVADAKSIKLLKWLPVRVWMRYKRARVIRVSNKETVHGQSEESSACKILLFRSGLSSLMKTTWMSQSPLVLALPQLSVLQEIRHTCLWKRPGESSNRIEMDGHDVKLTKDSSEVSEIFCKMSEECDIILMDLQVKPSFYLTNKRCQSLKLYWIQSRFAIETRHSLSTSSHSDSHAYNNRIPIFAVSASLPKSRTDEIAKA